MEDSTFIKRQQRGAPVNDALDLGAILASAQSLSECVDLSKLLEEFATIILQMSGAERLVLLLPNEDDVWEARVSATPEETQLFSEPLHGNPSLPVQLIQYVQQTREIFLADGLASERPFVDSYLQQNPSCSLVCVPLLHQNKLSGVLYLDHSSVSDVFNQERITVVDFLCCQTAMALKNIRPPKDIAECEELQRQHDRLTATLEATHQRLHNVLEHSSIGIWEWSFTEQRLTWDQQMFQIYGVDPDDFRGTYEDFSQRLHPDDFERVSAAEQRRVETARPFPDEFRIIRPDGEVRHVYANVFFERNEEGETASAVVGVNFDITDRRKAELALRDAQSQFQRMTKNVPGMIYRYVQRTDGSHAMTYVSSQCRELYGIEPEEVMEDADKLFDSIHPDDIDSIHNATKASAKNLTPFDQEFRVILPNQGLRWRQAISKPTRADNGDIFWDGVAIDTTHNKQAELQLQLANEELATATKMKDEFLANMSHELRTPLNAILGMTEGLQGGIFGPVTERQREGYEVIQQSGAHLLELINEVLDLAKIESGSMDLELSPVDVTQLCESSLQLVQQQAAKKQIQLNLNAPFNLPEFDADEKRLRQVLVNLLSNAVKFTPSGGLVKLEVQRLNDEKQNHDKTIRISVSDNGIGIESSHLETMFDPFVQIDSALNRNYTGTGLGLSLVKRFVELHSGSVSVTSEPGVGSCFSVDLPLRNRTDVPATASPQRIDPPGKLKTPNSSEATQSAFILLAEDNELVAKATTRFLEASGFRVELATNGGAAIEAARDQLLDVILMDIQMPGVDGLEAIQRIRQFPEHKETLIIAMTGLAMQSDSDRCLAAGADHYLSKPYGMQQLVDLIRKQLLKRNTNTLRQKGEISSSNQ